MRAIAVLSVVTFHAADIVLPGGFVGVDIFFVISGYLISGILMDEMERRRFSLGGFYERRIRRLFPALFVMLASVMAAGLFLLPPPQMSELGHTGLSTIFFASNVDLFSMSGYFDSDAQARPLLHTWSLAVEEQFYLLFPIVLWVLMRVARRRLRLVLLAGALGSLALCVWVLARNPSAAFYLAPFRGFELLIGAMIARLPFPAKAPSWLRDGISLAGLGLIGLSLFLINGDMAFPGLTALGPCLGAACILFAGAGAPSLGGRVISNPASNFFGGISYSLYLWHWPLLVMGRALLLRAPTPLETVIILAIAVAVATVSWRWIEQPFIQSRGPRARIFAMGGACMIIGALATAAVVLSHGLPGRFGPEAQGMFAAREDFNPRRPECHHFLDTVTPYERNCSYGATTAAPTAAIWSDSHGTELAAAMGERVAGDGGAVLGITSSACPPATGYDSQAYPLCAAQNVETLRGLLHDKRIGTVYLAASYSGYPDRDRAAIREGVARSAEALAKAGKRIVLVYPIPVFGYDVPNALGEIVQRGGDPADYAISRSDHEAANREATTMLERLQAKLGAEAIRPADTLCDKAWCHAYRNGAALYFNRDHLSLAGARLVLDGASLTLTAPSHAVAEVLR